MLVGSPADRLWRRDLVVLSGGKTDVAAEFSWLASALPWAKRGDVFCDPQQLEVAAAMTDLAAIMV
jgi:hypothetical protein